MNGSRLGMGIAFLALPTACTAILDITDVPQPDDGGVDASVTQLERHEASDSNQDAGAPSSPSDATESWSAQHQDVAIFDAPGQVQEADITEQDDGAGDGSISVSGTTLTDGAPPDDGSDGASEGCVIERIEYPRGARLPGAVCKMCRPETSHEQWSTAPEGTACPEDGRFCHEGACQPGCSIASTYVAPGRPNPDDPCQSCDPSQSTTAWSDTLTTGCVQGISAGSSHTCAIVKGAAWCWGANQYGQLGTGTTSASSATPVPVRGLATGVQFISAGTFHTCAVADGSVYCWGYNADGQLGTKPTDASPPMSATPTRVPDSLGIGRVRAISAGNAHTCAIQTDVAYCWGSNATGQLGTIRQTDAGTSKSTPTVVLDITGVQAIAAGGRHSCAVARGAAYCWGYGAYGQIGNGSTTTVMAPARVSGLDTGVQAIVAGADHSCAIADGAVWCWGQGSVGQLGDDGGMVNRLKPVRVVALDAGARAVATGAASTCAVVSGTVSCWGRDTTFTIGGASTFSTVPVLVKAIGTHARLVAVGSDHRCATAGDKIWCWGTNANGQLGDDGGQRWAPTNPVPFP